MYMCEFLHYMDMRELLHYIYTHMCELLHYMHMCELLQRRDQRGG